jgi:hypothetical protein
MRQMSSGVFPVKTAEPEVVAKELETVFGLDKDGPLILRDDRGFILVSVLWLPVRIAAESRELRIQDAIRYSYVRSFHHGK